MFAQLASYTALLAVAAIGLITALHAASQGKTGPQYGLIPVRVQRRRR